MSPGTISGASDPDDRLHREAGSRRFPAPTGDAGEASPVSPALSAPTGRGVWFLLLALIGGLVFVALLVRPTRDALAWALHAMGVPVLGPSAYPGLGTWERALLLSPWTYFVHVMGLQLLFMLYAVLGAVLLRGRLRDRLGLRAPRGGWRVIGIAVALETLLIAFGIGVVWSVLPAGFEPPRGRLELMSMLDRAPLGVWLAVVFAISIPPAIAEESVFRGLIQRQLLSWWRPAAAILVTALIFAVAHPPLVRMMMLLPGCIWLGYLAWRCGSIVPGMVVHAFSNAGLQILSRMSPGEPTDEGRPARWIFVLVTLASAAAAAWLLMLLHRWTRAPSPGAAVSDAPRPTPAVAEQGS
jgi:membrane protease YdiL (CAAX protease family)